MTTPRFLQQLYEHTMTAHHALHEAIRLANIAPITPEQAERQTRMVTRAEKRLRAAVGLLNDVALAHERAA